MPGARYWHPFTLYLSLERFKVSLKEANNSLMSGAQLFIITLLTKIKENPAVTLLRSNLLISDDMVVLF